MLLSDGRHGKLMITHDSGLHKIYYGRTFYDLTVSITIHIQFRYCSYKSSRRERFASLRGQLAGCSEDTRCIAGSSAPFCGEKLFKVGSRQGRSAKFTDQRFRSLQEAPVRPSYTQRRALETCKQPCRDIRRCGIPRQPESR